MSAPPWAHGFAALIERPDGTIKRGITFDSPGAAAAGDPNFGGVCPGYRVVGYSIRTRRGWLNWRKDLAA